MSNVIDASDRFGKKKITSPVVVEPIEQKYTSNKIVVSDHKKIQNYLTPFTFLNNNDLMAMYIVVDPDKLPPPYPPDELPPMVA